MTIFLQAAAGGGNYSFLIMMVLIFAIMWFFMIRPQQKKQKEIQNFRNNIAIGTNVVTAGGIYGTVKKVDMESNTLMVAIANDIVIKVDRNSVFATASDNATRA
ncbi:MAG: preprotein translocase subunit YajC [Bacteroidaceae bacterium]|nr:preprotein translocase subunit YajC [Bacteroidaceae bacterium]